MNPFTNVKFNSYCNKPKVLNLVINRSLVGKRLGYHNLLHLTNSLEKHEM